MTQYTENYNLELYEGTDKADLTDQYNVSMRLVDEALKGVDTDTKAEIARLEGDLATTNSNLNATNQNAAALKKEVEDNYAQQLATDAQQQTEIDALRNANSPSGADFQALSTKVTNNTTLVEEHVNYFADLGVTDEQSAHDLHNQIDNTYQGVMSNTQSIDELSQRIKYDHLFTKVGESKIIVRGKTLGDFIVYANPEKTAIKINCILSSADEVAVQLENIPGTTLNGFDTGVDFGKTSVEVPGTYTGIGFVSYNDSVHENLYRAAIGLGEDNHFYLWPNIADSITMGPKYFQVMWSFDLSIDIAPQTLTLGDIAVTEPPSVFAVSRDLDETYADWRMTPVPPEVWKK